MLWARQLFHCPQRERCPLFGIAREIAAASNHPCLCRSTVALNTSFSCGGRTFCSWPGCVLLVRVFQQSSAHLTLLMVLFCLVYLQPATTLTMRLWPLVWSHNLSQTSSIRCQAQLVKLVQLCQRVPPPHQSPRQPVRPPALAALAASTVLPSQP